MTSKLFAFNVSKPIDVEAQAEWQGANTAVAGYAAYCTRGGQASVCYDRCRTYYSGSSLTCELLGPSIYCWWYQYKCDWY